MKKRSRSYENAKARVKGIKGFYNHLFIYLVFLVLWIVFADKILGVVKDNVANSDVGFNEWAKVNYWINPLIWGVVVLFHGVYVFGFKSSFFRKWEAKKLQEYMDEEAAKSNQQYE